MLAKAVFLTCTFFNSSMVIVCVGTGMQLPANRSECCG